HVRAHMKGNGQASLAEAWRIVELLPGSLAPPLLVAGMALQMGLPRGADSALALTQPDFGANFVTPYYWLYTGEAAHQLGHCADALQAARTGGSKLPKYLAQFELNEAHELAHLHRASAVHEFLARSRPLPEQLTLAAAAGEAMLM